MQYFVLIVVAVAAYLLIKLHKRENSDENKLDLTNNVAVIKDSIFNFLKTDDYIYDYDVKTFRKKIVKDCDELIGNASRLNKDTNEQFADLKEKVDSIESAVSNHNEAWLDTNIKSAYNLVGEVEGQLLDRQQMECIVKNPQNQLVIAGAGTGKTTTIIGKVKYLLGKGLVRPEEILILSYTHTAASEMAERLERETHTSIDVSTFHKLGLNIVTIARNERPDIYSGDGADYIGEALKSCMKESSFALGMLHHMLYGRVETDQKFNSREEYLAYVVANPPETIKGEKVKSFGEVMIANFLVENNINYIYEAKYKFNTRDEKHSQYKPDFYLPDYDIYIEYFGIDRNGNVAPFFRDEVGKSASAKYNEGIKWKRKIHKANNTVLIECYSYEQFEHILLKELKHKLLSHNIVLDPQDYATIISENGQKAQRFNDSLKVDIKTIIGLAKGRGLDSSQLVSYAKDNCLTQYFLALCASKVLDKYQQKLDSENEIDFADMLNIATELVANGSYRHNYKYVIIDEYQDLIRGQFKLLNAMRNQCDFKLFAVGDDWQSIYRFSGSDINYILDFSKYWGDSEISKIERTYRFSQTLVDVSGGFVMSNPRQYEKQILSGVEDVIDACNEITSNTEKVAFSKMLDEVLNLPRNSTVFFIGRYNWDRNLLLEVDDRISLKYHVAEQKSELKITGRPDLKATFYTAHKSKGLQADYVFLINVKADSYGFPTLVATSPLVEALLEKEDQYPFSEERRLFYVAMTRAKKKLYIVGVDGKKSPFVKELEEKYPDKITSQKEKLCPLCGGKLVRRKGTYGYFYGCGNYAKTGCRYTEDCR